MKRAIISLLSFFGIGSLFAGDFYIENMTTANTADVIRYGNAETSLFAGRLDFTIPIYTLEDPDFNIDIALVYNSDGFKPHKSSGYVGYNWHLQAGGCITREVCNYPDEIHRQLNTGGHKREGMYSFVRHSTIDKNDVFLQNANAITNCNGSGSNSSYAGYNVGTDCLTSVDYMPDIYHFTFCGYQGSFMINNAGKTVILSGDYVSVDLSKTLDAKSETVLVPRPLPVDSSKITIKTTDGYTYVFGGELSALEYSLTLKNGQQEQQQTPPIINAWHLKKIIAPNGRTVTYYYTYKGEFGNVDNHIFSFRQYYDLFATPPENNGLPSPEQQTYQLRYSHVKECILDSICVSGTYPLKICCYKSLAEKQYKHAFYNQCAENYSLDSIQVISSGRIVSRAHLSYEYKSHITGGTNGFYWRFLSSVSLSGKGTYSLNYNHIRSYPSLYIYTNSGFTTLEDYYGYWKSTSLQGLLIGVALPTGGEQHFTYEENRYGVERRYRVINSHRDVELYSKTVSGNPIIGGARIKQIESYIDDNLMEKTTYSYNLDGTSNSSGIYYNHLLVYPENENGLPMIIKNGNNYSLLDTHVAYSYVEERKYFGSNTEYNKKSYTFSTGVNAFSTLGDASTNKAISDADEGLYGKISGVLTYDKSLNVKGKLLVEKFYKDNSLLRSILRIYNGVPFLLDELIPVGMNGLGCVDTIVIFSNYGDHPISRKLFIYPDVLDQEVVCEYNGGFIPTMLNKNFLYDKKHRLIYETVVDSKWITHFTKYTYPDNFHFSSSDVFFNPPAVYQLRKKHRINIPVEQVSGYVENGEEYITSGTANLYENIWVIEKFNSNAAHIPVRPDWDSINPHIFDSINNNHIDVVDYYPYLYKTMTLSLTAPIPASNYQWMSANGKSIVYDPHYKLKCEYHFDVMDRLTSIKPFGKIETRYTWNGIYPATKTIGNQTWTYTHIPHVGVNSITNPRGITTYYDYDSNGRLIKEYQIVNGKEQILNAYLYHIKTE